MAERMLRSRIQDTFLKADPTGVLTDWVEVVRVRGARMALGVLA